MENEQKKVLDDTAVNATKLEVTTINEADLSEIKEILVKQLEFAEAEKEEQLKKEKEEQKQLEEEQKQLELEQQEMEELTSLEQQEKEAQTEVTNTIAQNIESTAMSLGESNELTLELLDKLDLVIEQQQKINQSNVESGWLIVVSITLALGMRIFWDQMTKW